MGWVWPRQGCLTLEHLGTSESKERAASRTQNTLPSFVTFIVLPFARACAKARKNVVAWRQDTPPFSPGACPQPPRAAAEFTASDDSYGAPTLRHQGVKQDSRNARAPARSSAHRGFWGGWLVDPSSAPHPPMCLPEPPARAPGLRSGLRARRRIRDRFQCNRVNDRRPPSNAARADARQTCGLACGRRRRATAALRSPFRRRRATAALRSPFRRRLDRANRTASGTTETQHQCTRRLAPEAPRDRPGISARGARGSVAAPRGEIWDAPDGRPLASNRKRSPPQSRATAPPHALRETRSK